MAASNGLGRPLMLHYERNALQLRERAGLAQLAVFNPFEHLVTFDVIIKYPDEFTDTPDELIAEIEKHNAKDWSAVSDVLPNGKLLTLLNRNQTEERKNVTLLEEIAHQHYGHEPSVIGSDGRKNYDKAQEQEAYFTASAALLPGIAVARAVFQKKPAAEVARTFGASIDLYIMRVKTMSLWKEYQRFASEEAA